MNDKRQIGRREDSVMCDKSLSSASASTNNGDFATMVGPNFRVGKKIGCGNFGELRLGEHFLFTLIFNTGTVTEGLPYQCTAVFVHRPSVIKQQFWCMVVFFLSFFLLWVGTRFLRMPALRPDSQAGPMH